MRLRKVIHGRNTVVWEDKETYRLRVSLKLSMLWIFDWILPIPGEWHLMLYASKALLRRCYAAGTDDKYVAWGRKYRNWLIFMYVVLPRCVIKHHLRVHAGVPPRDREFDRKVIPWLRNEALQKRSPEFSMNCPWSICPSLAIRVEVRTADLELRIAGILEFSAFFAGTGKD